MRDFIRRATVADGTVWQRGVEQGGGLLWPHGWSVFVCAAWGPWVRFLICSWNSNIIRLLIKYVLNPSLTAKELQNWLE